MATQTSPMSGGIEQEIASNLTYLKPEFRALAKKRFGNQWSTFFDVLMSMGYNRPTANTTYNWFEEGKKHRVVTLAATQTDLEAGDTAVTYVVEGDPDSSGRTSAFIRQYDLVEFPCGVKGMVSLEPTANSGDATHWDVTIVPIKKESVDGADEATLPTVNASNAVHTSANRGATSGDELIIYSNAHPEGSGQPTPRYKHFHKESGYTQIIKNALQTTGTAKTNRIWFSIEGANGRQTFFHVNQMDVEYRQKQDISHAFLVGSTITPGSAAAALETTKLVQSTEGMVDFATARGNAQSVAAGSYTMADFNDLETYHVSQRGSGVLMVSSGLTRAQEFNTLFDTQFNDSNIQRVDKMMDSSMVFSDQSLSGIMHYKALTTTNTTFIFTGMDLFNNPMTLAADDFKAKYQNMALIFPFGEYTDPKMGTPNPYVGFRYKQEGDYSRLMEVWDDGTAKPANRRGSIDEDNLYVRSDVGTEFGCGNMWQIITA